MKVLYLTESVGWSGGAEQLLMMARALRDRGHELTIGCQPGSDIMGRARGAGLSVESVRMRQDYDLLGARAVARMARRRGVDVLHAQHSTAHAIGLLASWWVKKPAFVVTRRVVFPIKRNPFSRWKYLSSRIAGYVAVCGPVKEELMKAGVPSARIEVIPSVINGHAVSRAEGESLRRELSLTAGLPLVGMVGNYADFKGHEYFLRAAAGVLSRFPSVRFLVAGRDTEKLRPMTEELGIAPSVLILGFRTDVPRILAALDIFVMPSLQEAAATALREAMAAGLPAIGTSVGGIPEAIQDGETGLLVPPADSERLAQAMMRLLEHPEWARTLAQCGQTWVRSQFSLERAATQMEAFYQRLILARDRGGR